MRKDCNICAKDYCGAARKAEMIYLEKEGLNTCFVPPRVKTVSFAAAISKVTISNPKSKVVGWFMEYAK